MLDCPDLSVPHEVMQHVVHVESSRNPFAIGVVGGYLASQPKNLVEALAAVRQLKEEGYNFSVGIAQVNRYNLAKYGLNTYAEAFDVCSNLKAGSRILRECYDRAQDWGKAFSCYYSGNFATGFDHGYVQKIFASMRKVQFGLVAQAEPVRIILSRAVHRQIPAIEAIVRDCGGAGQLPDALAAIASQRHRHRHRNGRKPSCNIRSWTGGSDKAFIGRPEQHPYPTGGCPWRSLSSYELYQSEALPLKDAAAVSTGLFHVDHYQSDDCRLAPVRLLWAFMPSVSMPSQAHARRIRLVAYCRGALC
ncbi:MAG: lytic transglycosylase domain-containing protein [Hydrogenophaga sp.]|jgi:hypothetical protein|nr:lytic transglycosylase domain-containing protein [Hydrogenophaga sp.]